MSMCIVGCGCGKPYFRALTRRKDMNACSMESEHPPRSHQKIVKDVKKIGGNHQLFYAGVTFIIASQKDFFPFIRGLISFRQTC